MLSEAGFAGFLGIFRIAGDRLMPVRRILFALGERVGRRGARIRDTQLEGMHANRCPAESGTLGRDIGVEQNR